MTPFPLFSPNRRYLVALTLILGSLRVQSYSWFSSSSPTSEDASAQDFLVSPIVNRELEASVVAHDWPFTPQNVICEAALGFYETGWKSFLDQWVDDIEQKEVKQDVSSSEVTRRVLDLVADSRERSLLSYGLALRAYSPLCELHRVLARDLLMASMSDVIIHPNTTVDAFVHVILDEEDVLITNPEQISQRLGQENIEISSINLLPGEVAWPQGEQLKPTVALYANMASPAFVTLYRSLQQYTDVSFVVRHIGDAFYESGRTKSSPTVLQGYGVRLDIRNVEYRVFDERGGDKEADDKALMVNVTSLDETIEHQFLAGVNPAAWKDANEIDKLDLQAKLWKIHEARQLQSQRIPPQWQRRQLSLQAASAISSSAENDESADPLLILQDISQNLPSVASTLVHLDVSSPELIELAGAMEKLLPSKRGALLFVNGRRIPIDRPSFNVFELFHLIKQEQKELISLREKLQVLPKRAMRGIHSAWTMGGDALIASVENHTGGEPSTNSADRVVRVDVGRGWRGAILYVNDIEKDSQYAAWPRQVQQMLFSMQFGVAPTVRRNMFTFLAVMDPIDDLASENAAFMLGLQLMQSSYPARLGVLLVNDGDLDSCAEWVQTNGITDEDIPCPVKPLFITKVSRINDLDAFGLTTQAVHKLFSHVCLQDEGEGMAPAYLQYVLQMLDQLRVQKGAPLSLKDLVGIHADILSQMGFKSESEAREEGLRVLASNEEKVNDGEAPRYGKALRFALNKGVRPGMGFVNGRALPDAADEGGHEKIGQIFSEEQNYILKLIMSREITDTR
jgi:hypothetical protein